MNKPTENITFPLAVIMKSNFPKTTLYSRRLPSHFDSSIEFESCIAGTSGSRSNLMRTERDK